MFALPDICLHALLSIFDKLIYLYACQVNASPHRDSAGMIGDDAIGHQ